jgi:hypothetical protein
MLSLDADSIKEQYKSLLEKGFDDDITFTKSLHLLANEMSTSVEQLLELKAELKPMFAAYVDSLVKNDPTEVEADGIVNDKTGDDCFVHRTK